MKFGEITFVIILATAFSGFGLAIIRWLFKRNRNQKSSVIKQSGNIVGGDMAGGNITKNELGKGYGTKK